MATPQAATRQNGYERYEALTSVMVHGYGPSLDLDFAVGLNSLSTAVIAGYLELLVPQGDRLPATES